MSTHPRGFALAVAFWLAFAGSAAKVQAQSEGEAAIGPVAGYGELRADGRWHGGFLAGVEGRWGLSDSWAIGGTVTHGWYGENAQTSGGSLGVIYAVDVLRVVPFATLGLALNHLSGAGAEASTFLGFEVGGGVTYLLDRRWSCGLAIRSDLFGPALEGKHERIGTAGLLTALVSLSRLF